MQKHSAEFSIALMCKVLDVSRSGYYDWLTHKPSKRELANQALDMKIKDIYKKHKKRYGSPRITKELKLNDEQCSNARVARRMRAMDIKAIAKRKYKVTTDSDHNKSVYQNILNRDFTTSDINQKWCGDITYIKTNEGWMYLATVIDIHSRAVIGWSMNKRMKQSLVCNALTMALFNRGFPKGVMMHTDRGSQYCANNYKNIIKNCGLIGSMSRKGNCWDNAIAESFFHTLKVELIHENSYKTREEARQSIFEYIECYYNKCRMHSALNYKTPFEVEKDCEKLAG
jgi:putative transposase